MFSETRLISEMYLAGTHSQYLVGRNVLKLEVLLILIPGRIHSPYRAQFEQTSAICKQLYVLQ